MSEVLDIYAGSIVGQQAAGKAAYEAEVAKLGAAGPARIDALSMWMRGVLGDRATTLMGAKDAAGKIGGGVMWTAGIVEAFEALQQKFVSQGAGGYTAHGRDNGAGDGKIPNFAGMSFEQRRLAQDQARSRGR